MRISAVQARALRQIAQGHGARVPARTMAALERLGLVGVAMFTDGQMGLTGDGWAEYRRRWVA